MLNISSLMSRVITINAIYYENISHIFMYVWGGYNVLFHKIWPNISLILLLVGSGALCVCVYISQITDFRQWCVTLEDNHLRSMLLTIVCGEKHVKVHLRIEHISNLKKIWKNTSYVQHFVCEKCSGLQKQSRFSFSQKAQTLKCWCWGKQNVNFGDDG